MSSNNLQSLKEAADRVGYSRQRLQQWVKQGRIKGAVKVGHYWVIPTTWKPTPRAHDNRGNHE